MEYERVLVFGEVLFDCFPTGERVLGGAPFNVAWHLQALGDAPLLISRVGEDAAGAEVLRAMAGWGMDAAAVQRDPEQQTGAVQVRLEDGEPSYEITAPVAYDFIDAGAVPVCAEPHILYHGSLALRSPASSAALDALAAQPGCAIFFDVNLRAPWWDLGVVESGLHRARWAKMNIDELRALGFDDEQVETAMRRLQVRFGVAQVLLTLGPDGAAVCSEAGEVTMIPPAPLAQRVDPVGAGDALSAVYLHGMRRDWAAVEAVEKAQQFAARIIGQRGATPTALSFYDDLAPSA